MNNKNDLTKDRIFTSILFLALPIMGTSFVQMAYNLIDMIWIGKLGSSSTAAVGTAGFYMWFSMGIIFLCRIGAEVLVAQSVGRKDLDATKETVQNVLQMTLFSSLFFMIIVLLFKDQMIAFFDIKEAHVVEMAVSYLGIVALGFVFTFLNPIFTAIFNGYGKSGVPFAINTIGLVFNIIFDPLLIFGLGPFPALGVKGAAIATVTAQMIVTLVFIFYIRRNKDIHMFEGLHIFNKPNKDRVLRILKIGLPAGLQSMLFTIFAMIIARIIADWGAVAIAVQKVGSQIESVSWMTASGFSTATSTFVGQNYGAGKYDRIKYGYRISLIIMTVIGLMTTFGLIYFAEPLFRIFINEEVALKEGVIYLQILGVSQLFMCIEIVTNGAFNGLGKTMYPAVNSTVFNFLRIPLALYLSSTVLSLQGVWWSISISSILKGIVIVSLFIWTLFKVKRELEQPFKEAV
ncbi:MATE family efflux transporter [Acidaminobacter sp. JC074]|uniref:MATE family efflux transporter n=1 Tax=Acidaminobacter sp. JC074 TaxID=2530199 RepID=UPI001F0D0D0F|nr:MATE family efflux transporter [Acidaminobacter sp. JC074]MCH4886799.1 MATE family efflux transporter [Acidaminobacter sp. JC074]